MAWVPQPDGGPTHLPAEVGEVLEQLAETVHDTWARLRLEDDWSYGPKRDDDRKTNPTLVPYAELPESEKRCDREVVVAILRSVIRLGFELIPPEPPGIRHAD